MFCSDYLNFKILDIIRCTRGVVSLSTKNKGCAVISCRLSGSAVFHTGEQSYTVHVGDLLYIPAKASYTQSTNGEELIALHLEILGHACREIQHISPQDPQAVCACFEEMDALWREKASGYPYACMALLYQLIAHTGAALPEEPAAGNSWLSPAISYFNARFSDPEMSIAEGCRLCNISRVYFNRLFQQKFHITPVKYIHALRIQKAKLLLSNGGYTHHEIALLCGFKDTKYFYTVFKSVTGSTAGQYQKNIDAATGN